MFPLDDNHTTEPTDSPPLTPPVLMLSTMMRCLSLLTLTSTLIRVHYLALGNPSLVRCNGADGEDCSLCRVGFPALDRELMLVYDRADDRLWAAALPSHIKDTLVTRAASLPEHKRNFAIGWNGHQYHVVKDDLPQASDFTLAREERAKAIELLNNGVLNLAESIPAIANSAMLRLPAVTLAALSFGIEGECQDDVDLSDSSSVHW